jgi:predicted Zn-dependent protease
MADARFGYAGALVGLRRYREAREALTEAAALHPDQPRFKEALARLDTRGR